VKPMYTVQMKPLRREAANKRTDPEQMEISA